MKLTRPRSMIAVGVVSLALVAGGGAAIAASSSGGNADVRAAAERVAEKSERQSDLASRLGVTVEELEAAVTTAARERIDAAAQAGDITAAQAEALEAELDDGHLARELARPVDIAAKLGVTEEKLRAATTASHKAAMKARVDQAVEDGIITAEQAAELKERIDAAELPEPGAFGPRGLGGPGHHGPGLGLGFGPGFGPAPEGGLNAERGEVA